MKMITIEIDPFTISSVLAGLTLPVEVNVFGNTLAFILATSLAIWHAIRESVEMHQSIDIYAEDSDHEE